jgi:hypothetical protein
MVGSFRHMSARVPLDVDLEDRLLYGLTPTHFAYMVVALLAAFALWSSHLAPVPVRGVACSLVIGCGAVVAWGGWRGRAADAWLVDAVLFALRNHRFVWSENCLRIRRPVPSKRPAPPGAQPATHEADAVAAVA